MSSRNRWKYIDGSGEQLFKTVYGKGRSWPMRYFRPDAKDKQTEG